MTTYRISLAVLLAAHLGILWGVEALPTQDLPQHAATVRILIDYDDNALFQQHFELPSVFRPYYTMYYVWAWLAGFTSIDVALRLLLSIYALGIVGAFHGLVVAVSNARPGGVPWPGLWGPTLIWSPVACMGFLGFMFAVPLVLVSCLLLVRSADEARPINSPVRVALYILPVLVATVHTFAAAGLVLVLTLWAWRTSGSSRRLALVLAALTLITIGGWMALAGVPRSEIAPDVTEAIRTAYGLEFVNTIFQVKWYDPIVTLNYFLWTVLGPYRLTGLLGVFVILTGLGWAVWRSARDAGRELSASPHPLRWVAVAMILIAWFLPWGLSYPYSGTFLNLRILVLGFALLVATLPADWFDAPRARAALLVVVAALTFHFGYRAIAYSRTEARPALALVSQVPPGQVLSSAMFHNVSDHFGKVFRITHNFPTYYLTQSGGISRLFWGRFTAHLPIRWRQATRPPRAPEWRPWRMKPEDLEGSDYFFVQLPHPNTPRRLRDAYTRAAPMISEKFEQIGCDRSYCLYRAR